MSIFNHVQIKVRNLKISREFYNAIMGALGYQVVLEIRDIVIGYGTNVHDMFEIRQADEKTLLSKSVHLAFNTRSKEHVEAFYYKALLKGGVCNGKPGYRSEYEDGYYAAFVIDPDGNNIEAVFSEKK